MLKTASDCQSDRVGATCQDKVYSQQIFPLVGHAVVMPFGLGVTT
jgi:hypothetical protein